jgi:myo-inositol-1(or 4)-monophosphatase
MTVKDARLSMAMSLARTAGTAIRRRDLRRTARWKRPGERVTAEDLLTQADLVRQLGTRFPSDGVLAEEGIRSFYLDREFVWVIDPLDGTNNYALGIPCFAVSIGILRAGQPYAGVIHDPNTGFTCFAAAGRGAFAGDQPLAVAPRPLDEASNVCVRAPVSEALRPLVAEWLSRYKLRSFGSVALNLAYAALGGIDVVLDDRAAIWDVAAAAAILLEAGAAITDFAGRPLFPLDLTGTEVQRVPFVAGNPTAHAGALADIGDLTTL